MIAKWATGVIIAFLAFAPPGTMIVIGLLLLWLLNGYWMIAIPVFAILVVLAILLYLRQRQKKVR